MDIINFFHLNNRNDTVIYNIIYTMCLNTLINIYHVVYKKIVFLIT